MHGFLYKLFQNISTLYNKRNLIWQIVFVIATYILVNTGFDWFYYQSTRGATLQSFLFPAVILGFLVPVFLPVVMLLYSLIKKNKKFLNTTYTVIQSGLLGLAVSSFYKVFTGRVGPQHILSGVDITHMFRFGFYRGGAFQGWPSSHTTVAFAVSMAIFTLYPNNKFLRILCIIYATYIGIGISVNIHWFSDFVAGVILGTIIGVTVGKSFIERYKNISNNTATK